MCTLKLSADFQNKMAAYRSNNSPLETEIDTVVVVQLKDQKWGCIMRGVKTYLKILMPIPEVWQKFSFHASVERKSQS